MINIFHTVPLQWFTSSLITILSSTVATSDFIDLSTESIGKTVVSLSTLSLVSLQFLSIISPYTLPVVCEPTTENGLLFFLLNIFGNGAVDVSAPLTTTTLFDWSVCDLMVFDSCHCGILETTGAGGNWDLNQVIIIIMRKNWTSKLHQQCIPIEK